MACNVIYLPEFPVNLFGAGTNDLSQTTMMEPVCTMQTAQYENRIVSSKLSCPKSQSMGW